MKNLEEFLQLNLSEIIKREDLKDKHYIIIGLTAENQIVVSTGSATFVAANCYQKADGKIILLWNDQQALSKSFVSKRLTEIQHCTLPNVDFRKLTLKSGEQIVGIGAKKYDGLCRNKTFGIVDADNGLLRYIPMDTIANIDPIEATACSDYASYAISDDLDRLIRVE